MYSLDYGLTNSVNYYVELVKDYDIFTTLLFAFLILGFLMFFNINDKNNSILTILLNMLFIFLIFYCFGLEILNHLDSALNLDFMHNICFYYVNTIFAMLLSSFKFTGLKTSYGAKSILIILYLLILLNLSFALYISFNLNGDMFIILGNTYPMILVGNLLAILLYIYYTILIVAEKSSKYYDNKKHLLYN